MSEWQTIDTIPMDGTDIFVFAPGYDWPEVVRYVHFDEQEASEVGELGYWRYSEDLLSDVCVIEFDSFTHWATIDLPPLPAIPAIKDDQIGQ